MPPDPVSAVLSAIPAAGPVLAGVDILLDAISRVVKEYEIAKASGEVVSGEQLVQRSAARVAAAAADPGLPREVLPG